MGSKGSVLVAMSGGVDSSVSACLLAEQGYEVLGSHMNLVHLADGVDHGCCGPSARADAEAVARIGGFAFEVVDMSASFAETVLADFFGEHEAGRTPNPCARCNEHIKFGAFLERADRLGVDLVATGHYVRTDRDPTGRWHLLRGADDGKDQSYMLHTLGQRELARARFPVGQRRGIGVSTGERSYVVEVDARANRVVVGPGDLLSRRGLVADRVSWVGGEPPAAGPFEAEVRIRYNGEGVPAVVDMIHGRLRVEFRRPQRGVAPGQSVVVYRGDELLGGARIIESLR